MIVYLDSSSIAKLYVLEPAVAGADRQAGWESEQVRRLCIEATNLFASRVAYIEVRAALARRKKEGYFVNAEMYDAVVQDFNADWQHRILRLEVTDTLVLLAANLAEKHGLRAYDAVHLASALSLRERINSDVSFSTWDNNLREAAATEGLVLAHIEGT